MWKLESTYGSMILSYLWRAMGCPEPTLTACPFTDVGSDAYYYKAVLWAAEKGIAKGTTAVTFSPNDAVTRGQAVSFLYRAAGMPKSGTSNPFSDVGPNDYWYDAVLWAAEKTITGGTSAATYSPADGCTRSQIITFLYRFLGR